MDDFNVNKSYYAVLPATVRYDKGLSPNAKLLFAEVTALCNDEGYCWASNQYFATLYGVEKRTIQRWIDSLIEKKYIKKQLIYQTNSKKLDKRLLYLGDDKNVTTHVTKMSPPHDKNVTTPVTKMSPIILKNNIKTNNKKKNIKKEKIESYSSNKELVDALLEFVEMRKQNKKPMTDRAVDLILKKLDGMASNDREKLIIVNQSIEHGWLSFYPVNKQTKVVLTDYPEWYKNQEQHEASQELIDEVNAMLEGMG